MQGLWIDQQGLRLRQDLPEPEARTGWTRIRVQQAGVCATDLALVRGYMGFSGTPGHEFVGEALDGPYVGQRVVGEINAACGKCRSCKAGLGRHCPNRSVLGILNHPGAFAEQLQLPDANVLPVPDCVSNDAATLTEPLAAAFEILEQLPPGQLQASAGLRALVVGDGRLGLLCAWALADNGLNVEVAGRHPERGKWLQPHGIRHRGDVLAAPGSDAELFDIVVEATGHPASFSEAVSWVRPRGTLVLKTTAESAPQIDLAPIVIHEITVIGSRCGPFAPALAALEEQRLDVAPLIHARYPLPEGTDAFSHAGQAGTLKVIVEVA